jgi:5-methyltetrahydrofolate--homocysteine methyltransferase
MNLAELLQQKRPLVFDGAMGSELSRRGLQPGCELNLSEPQQISAMHHEYTVIGVDFLTTNTFTANRIYLETHGQEGDLQAINRAGVELAREAAGPKQYVIGDIGPTGRLLKPYGEYAEEQFMENFREQALVMIESGADGLLVETMTDLREALCALKACREVTSLPVMVTLSYSTTDKGGRTIMGSGVAEAATELEKHGAAVVGANCGDLDPLQMAEIAALYRQHTSLPIMIQPNAGIPKLVGGKTVYGMNPTDFAAGVARCIENGASIVGGCCGTTLDHIRSIIHPQ